MNIILFIFVLMMLSLNNTIITQKTPVINTKNTKTYLDELELDELDGDEESDNDEDDDDNNEDDECSSYCSSNCSRGPFHGTKKRRNKAMRVISLIEDTPDTFPWDEIYMGCAERIPRHTNHIFRGPILYSSERSQNMIIIDFFIAQFENNFLLMNTHESTDLCCSWNPTAYPYSGFCDYLGMNDETFGKFHIFHNSHNNCVHVLYTIKKEKKDFDSNYYSNSDSDSSFAILKDGNELEENELEEANDKLCYEFYNPTTFYLFEFPFSDMDIIDEIFKGNDIKNKQDIVKKISLVQIRRKFPMEFNCDINIKYL